MAALFISAFRSLIFSKMEQTIMIIASYIPKKTALINSISAHHHLTTVMEMHGKTHKNSAYNVVTEREMRYDGAIRFFIPTTSKYDRNFSIRRAFRPRVLRLCGKKNHHKCYFLVRLTSGFTPPATSFISATNSIVYYIL